MKVNFISILSKWHDPIFAYMPNYVALLSIMGFGFYTRHLVIPIRNRMKNGLEAYSSLQFELDVLAQIVGESFHILNVH